MAVVVVGGGIVGLSSAYSLARRNIDVTLFEKQSLGMASTSRSIGGIRSQFGTPVNVELSEASKEVWDEFEARFGVDIDYRKTGYLLLARSEETADHFERTVEMQREHGAETRYLDPDEAAEYCAGVDPEQFVAAAYNPDDGFADPNLAVQGYATAAREAGVDIVTGTEVTDVVLENRAVSGIEIDGERHEAEYVVNAGGAEARRVGKMAGVDLPIRPRRRQIAIVEPSQSVPEDDPLMIDLDSGSFFRPERDGDAIIGGHFDEDDTDVDPEKYDDSMDIDWAADAIERAAEWTTYFDIETRIKRGWAGLYAVTPDNHPIIEEVIPGFVVAGGFSGHGFLHAPATGQLVAEIVDTGSPELVDISMLTHDRFETGDEIVESNVI